MIEDIALRHVIFGNKLEENYALSDYKMVENMHLYINCSYHNCKMDLIDKGQPSNGSELFPTRRF